MIQIVLYHNCVESVELTTVLIAIHFQNIFTVIVEQREQVPFSLVRESWELVHEGSPKHLLMVTARLK